MKVRSETSRWSIDKSMMIMLFLVAVCFRLPAVSNLPGPRFYNIDELALLDSVLGLIGGETPNSLQWPSATLLVAFLPLVLGHFLLTSPGVWEAIVGVDPHAFASALTLYLGRCSYDPNSLLVPMRMGLAVVTSLTAPAIFMMLRQSRGRSQMILVGLVLASSPVLVQQTAVVKGDGVGLLFWVLALGTLLAEPREHRPSRSTNDSRLAISAVFLGFATASRLTHVVALPVLIAHSWWGGARRRFWRTCGVGTMAFGVPILVFLPFIWTQPFTFAKAVLGNVVLLSGHGGGSQSMSGMFAMLVGLVGPLAIVLAGLGLFALFSDGEKRGVGGFTVVVFLVFAVPLARAGYVQPHYTLPLLPVLALWAGAGGGLLSSMVRRRIGTKAEVGLAIAFAVIMVGLNGFEVLRWSQSVRQPPPRIRAAMWIDAETDAERLVLPVSLLPHVPPDERSLEAILERYDRSRASASTRVDRMLQQLTGREDSQRLPFVLEQWLSDDEAIDLFRYRAMLYSAQEGQASPRARSVTYYEMAGAEPGKPDRIACREAHERLIDGRADLLLADSDCRAPGKSTLIGREIFPGWWVYEATESLRDQIEELP